MSKVIIIDNKELALDQVKANLPASAQVELVRYASFADYKAAGSPQATVLFLDFFLNKDQTTGVTVVKSLNCEVLVGFSSLQEGSDAILEEGLKSGKALEKVFAVQKDKTKNENPDLQAVLKKLFP